MSDKKDKLKPSYHPETPWAVESSYILGIRMLCGMIAGILLIWGGIVWIIQDRKEFETLSNKNIHAEEPITEKEMSHEEHSDAHLSLEEDARKDNLVPPMVGFFILLISIGYAKMFFKARKLDKEGIITQGTIIDRWTIKNLLGQVSYFIAYQFGEEEFEATQRVNEMVYQHLQNRETVEIIYLSKDPARCSRMKLNKK